MVTTIKFKNPNQRTVERLVELHERVLDGEYIVELEDNGDNTFDIIFNNYEVAYGISKEDFEPV